MRILLTLTFIVTISATAISQNIQENEFKNESLVKTYLYAYITIQGKGLFNKLKVEVDFGDSDEQTKEGKEYSLILTNKKSFAAILNYMAERQFELVTTREETYTYQGTGATYGVIFIMRKKTINVRN